MEEALVWHRHNSSFFTMKTFPIILWKLYIIRKSYRQYGIFTLKSVPDTQGKTRTSHPSVELEKIKTNKKNYIGAFLVCYFFFNTMWSVSRSVHQFQGKSSVSRLFTIIIPFQLYRKAMIALGNGLYNYVKTWTYTYTPNSTHTRFLLGKWNTKHITKIRL